nr:hypothetical protein [Kiritimatiellia bacterium]
MSKAVRVALSYSSVRSVVSAIACLLLAPAFCAGAADRPPSVRGIDFWAHDRLHVPLTPTRNLLPNPSFESGLRYWRF